MTRGTMEPSRSVGVVLSFVLSFVIAFAAGCGGTVEPTEASRGRAPADASTPSDPDGDPPRSDTTDIPCDVYEALESCRGCHGSTPRFGAPMSLLSRSDFFLPTPTDPSVPVFATARARIHDPVRPMPPPSQEPLSDAALATLTAWLDAGAPMGSCGAAPPPDVPRDPIEDLPCEPTHVLRAHDPGTTEPFSVPSDAANLYKCFAFRPEWEKDTQATAWAPVIGDERVVHHWILYKVPVPRAEGAVIDCTAMPLDAQFVMGWAPGSGATVMPDGVGFELPNPGETLLLQLHYYNAAGHTDARDDSGVAICATDTPRPETAGIIWLGTLNVAIPPRARGWTTIGHCPGVISATLPSPINVLSAFPHMHALARSLRTDILRVGGGRDTLVEVEPWDFNDQHEYPAEPGLQIHPGDTLQTTCVYDNPSDVPVFFGERTEDEMCFNFVTVYPTEHLLPERRCFGVL